MDKRIKEMVVIPEGAPYGLHITYHYGDESSSSSQGSCPSPQGLRSVFTKQQVMALEAEFQRSKYINNELKKKLATILGMQEKQVKDWFQNRRSKARRDGEKFNKVKRSREPENNGETFDSVKRLREPKDNEVIYDIVAFLQDRETGVKSTEAHHNGMYDLEETLEVLRKHAQSPPLKRRRIEITEHLMYDPNNRMWKEIV